MGKKVDLKKVVKRLKTLERKIDNIEALLKGSVSSESRYDPNTSSGGVPLRTFSDITNTRLNAEKMRKD